MVQTFGQTDSPACFERQSTGAPEKGRARSSSAILRARGSVLSLGLPSSNTKPRGAHGSGQASQTPRLPAPGPFSVGPDWRPGYPAPLRQPLVRLARGAGRPTPSPKTQGLKQPQPGSHQPPCCLWDPLLQGGSSRGKSAGGPHGDSPTSARPCLVDWDKLDEGQVGAGCSCSQAFSHSPRCNWPEEAHPCRWSCPPTPLQLLGPQPPGEGSSFSPIGPGALPPSPTTVGGAEPL